jgi:hypothetical protein
MRIGGVKEAAQRGLDAEHVEVVLGGLDIPALVYGACGADPGALKAIGGQTGEGVIAVAQVAVIRVGFGGRRGGVAGGRAYPVEELQLLGLRQRERAQDQRVEHTEDYGIRADAEREGEHDSDREPG